MQSHDHTQEPKYLKKALFSLNAVLPPGAHSRDATHVVKLDSCLAQLKSLPVKLPFRRFSPPTRIQVLFLQKGFLDKMSNPSIHITYLLHKRFQKLCKTLNLWFLKVTCSTLTGIVKKHSCQGARNLVTSFCVRLKVSQSLLLKQTALSMLLSSVCGRKLFSGFSILFSVQHHAYRQQ